MSEAAKFKDGSWLMKSLDRLLRPKSIVIIGGSWAHNVIKQLQKSRFGGKIWWVHPDERKVAGVEWIPDLDHLPQPPDAAFVGVNRNLTIPMIERLAAMGAGGACCFASGFLESEGELAGGAQLQNALIKAAGTMPVLGPNCYGYINYLDQVTVWPDEHGGVAVNSGVAILTQSSNIAISFTMQQRGLPVAYMITTGNQAVISMASIADSLLDDDRVTAIGMHVEGYRDMRGFEALAVKAKRLGKPIVVFKVGQSDQARAATLSHTASLAGSTAGAAALAHRLGFAEVHTIPEFLEALKLLHQFGPLPGNRMASISCSGGEASIMADAATGMDLDYTPLSPGAEAKLKATLGEMVTIANPLDYHTYIWGDFEKMRDTYAAVIEDDRDLTFFVLDLPRADRCAPDAWFPAIESLKAAVRQTGARVAVVPTLPENLPEQLALELAEDGIASLYGVREAHAAAQAAWRAGQGIAQPPAQPLFIPAPQKAPSFQTKTLDEFQSKTLLREFGLNIPNGQRFTAAATLSNTDLELRFPLAVKALGIAHKSDSNAVFLDVEDARTLKEKAEMLPETPGGLLVEEMISGAVAEMIVGVTRDEAHGLLLTVGAGGVLTELLADTAHLLLPTTAEAIEHALQSLKIYPLLCGYRGKAAGDLAALIEQIHRISQFAISLGDDLEEMDINPLIVCQRGAKIADALIIVRRKN